MEQKEGIEQSLLDEMDAQSKEVMDAKRRISLKGRRRRRTGW